MRASLLGFLLGYLAPAIRRPGFGCGEGALQRVPQESGVKPRCSMFQPSADAMECGSGDQLD